LQINWIDSKNSKNQIKNLAQLVELTKSYVEKKGALPKSWTSFDKQEKLSDSEK
jgi:hypothetical protein